jgi:hypothetical protein
MTRVKKLHVNDRMPIWKPLMIQYMDDAIMDAASDIATLSKRRAPFKTGDLRRRMTVKKPRRLVRTVGYYIEYARFQEFGGDNRRTVRKYSTAGTGAHYLRNAGDQVAGKIKYKFKKHAR